MVQEQRPTYPYFPQKSWWDLRRRFVQSIPATVNREYLQAVLDVDAGTAKNYLAALETLGLIDENGKPTPLANDWRSDEHYAAACQQMIEHVYSQTLRDAFPEASSDKAAVERWLMRNTGVGQNAATKRASMYVLLRQAEPQAPEQATQRQRKQAGQARLPQVQSSRASPYVNGVNGSANGMALELASPPGAHHAAQPSLHIDIQIHIAADAPPDQIDQIFASMAKHLYNRE